MTATSPADRTIRLGTWRHLGWIVAAHVVMLRDAAILDDGALGAVLTALDGVRSGEPPAGSLADLVAAFDERLDALTPAGVTGAARVGRGTADVVAALVRMTLREDLVLLAGAANEVRRALLDLAATHVVTLMPAFSGGQAAQPTTFGHFLGGVLGPLGRTVERAQAAYAEVNRSPLGAGALASSGMGIDRERTAALLGFDGVVTNTFDAVAAVDHLFAAGDVAAAIAAVVRRFLSELLTWLRTDPGSVRLDRDWTGRLPDLPQLRPPARLEAAVERARRVEGDAATLHRVAAEAAYAPIASVADGIAALAGSTLAGCRDLLRETHALVTSGIEVNRAYLANRAGRCFTTSADLADFLMIEEQLDPGAARSIAQLTIGRAMEEGLETSGITPDLIDAAALLVIGREVKAEFEAISRYLAPRRFIERRTVTGAPSATATRAYLDQEGLRVGGDVRWHEETAARIALAEDNVRRIEGEAVSAIQG